MHIAIKAVLLATNYASKLYIQLAYFMHFKVMTL